MLSLSISIGAETPFSDPSSKAFDEQVEYKPVSYTPLPLLLEQQSGEFFNDSKELVGDLIRVDSTDSSEVTSHSTL